VARIGATILLTGGAAAGCGTSKNTLAPSAMPDPQVLPRMQAADSPPIRTSAKGNILDLASFETTGPSDSKETARIRATVNGVPILDDEVRKPIMPILMSLAALPEPERSARRQEAFQAAIERIVERELILQDLYTRFKDRPQIAEKLKEAAEKEFEKRIRADKKRMQVKDDDEFKAVLAQMNWSLEGYRRQITREFIKEEYVKNMVGSKIERIGNEQIREYYDNHPEEFRVLDNVTWQDIFIDAGKFPNRQAAEQFATQLAAKARAGEDFVKLVSKYDQGDSSYRNGEGIGHRKGEIKPPEAEAILFQMRDGEVGPIIAQPNGFHVIRLMKREYAGIRPFDPKTQTAVKNKLQMLTYEKEYKLFVADLKRKASIQISAAAP
jgi:parvulin-like peptidyl-prolyl isomerase